MLGLHKYHVYSLVSPETDEVIYVGVTRWPEIREREHLIHHYGPTRTQIQRVVADMRSCGIVPRFEIIETLPSVTDIHAREVERRWIKHFRSVGHTLFQR